MDANWQHIVPVGLIESGNIPPTLLYIYCYVHLMIVTNTKYDFRLVLHLSS